MKHFDGSSRESAMSSLNSAITWAHSPAPGISVAALSDDGQRSEAELRSGLSTHECEKSAAISDSTERRHYMFRRCFQRAFVGTVLNWDARLDALEVEHRLDTRPKCLQAPDLRLSFSASGFTAVACASAMHEVGIDVERFREIENVAALARRFFTESEAEMIASLPHADQNIGFLRFWTAKEAGLKAIGRGLVAGMNSFVMSPDGWTYQADIVEEFKITAAWRCVHLAMLPDHVLTVVHSPEK